MTMSHLLKQTKKCCAKIIRKLSFNPVSATNGSSGGADHSPTNNGHGLNNRITTAKYVLHKNCTPTRCKVQPRDGTVVDDGAVEGWMAADTRMAPDAHGAFYPLGEERSSSNPSPPPIPETQNNYKLSRSMKNLPKKRTNITANKNVNLRKCFRLRSKTFDGPLALEGGDGGGRTMQESTLGSTPSIVEGGNHHRSEGVGGERRETMTAADSMTLASNNSSSRLIGAKLDKISKSLMRSGDGEGSTLDIAKPLFLSASKHRRSNYNHIEGCDDDDAVIRGNDANGHWRQEEELVLTSATGTSALGRRESRLEQETTLSTMVEEQDPAAAAAEQTPSVMERLTVAETAAALLFEKVKYDRTKRYLIDQLTDGGGGGGEHGAASSPPSASSCCPSPFHLAKSEDFVDPWKNYNIRPSGTGWDKVSKSPWDSSAKPSPVRGELSKAPLTHTFVAIPPHQQQQHQSQHQTSLPSYQPMRTHWNPFEYSPAHLARLAAAGVNAQTTPPPHQQQQQYRPAFQVQTDVWENLNSKHYEIDTDVVWRSTRCSSRRTSASTVETWIDDETFDNSFNEELERRCATLKICE
ncbi:uncharacterized protein LOC5666936 [Anopheles gambiae]|uniref:uncharacterized protein LOC5666936 n=1 Tax=Anopheles gambiae TaxID=7165 RepID=UPI002AC923A0|nr:uncharacterized protein LOC5666936 [Anopheles gambiae]XP_061497210.1 uncharacterized protein LOC5666936 [Anopheles gambiae]